jgi:hypothetical protein
VKIQQQLLNYFLHTLRVSWLREAVRSEAVVVEVVRSRAKARPAYEVIAVLEAQVVRAVGWLINATY